MFYVKLEDDPGAPYYEIGECQVIGYDHMSNMSHCVTKTARFAISRENVFASREDAVQYILNQPNNHAVMFI